MAELPSAVRTKPRFYTVWRCTDCHEQTFGLTAADLSAADPTYCPVCGGVVEAIQALPATDDELPAL